MSIAHLQNRRTVMLITRHHQTLEFRNLIRQNCYIMRPNLFVV
jgi:hypothetical protein